MSELDDPYASPPPGWQPPAPPSPSPSPQPPASAPPGPSGQPPPPPSWQPQPPPYAAPPDWQPPPPPYGAPAGAYPPPYGAPGYQPYGYQPPGTTNGFAIASLVCAIALGIVPFLGGVLGVVFGIIGLRQCTRDRERGRGLAIAGLVVGGIAILFWILAFIGLAVGGGSSSSTPTLGALSYPS